MGIKQAAASFLTKLGRAADRAVLFNRYRCVVDKSFGEGTHYYFPWFRKPFFYDIHRLASVSSTKDLQMVNLTLRLVSRPHASRFPPSMKTLGSEYDEKVLPSIGNEVLNDVVAQFKADQLLTERPHVSALLRERLIRRAKEFNIELDGVKVTDLSYAAEMEAKAGGAAGVRR